MRELQDINQSALQQLAELGTRYAEVGPLLNRYLGEKGLTLPVVRSSSLGGRTKLTAGSVLSTHRRSVHRPSLLFKIAILKVAVKPNII